MKEDSIAQFDFVSVKAEDMAGYMAHGIPINLVGMKNKATADSIVTEFSADASNHDYTATVKPDKNHYKVEWRRK